MDEQRKAIQSRIDAATTALTTANAELTAAKEANDEAKTTEAQSKIESITSEKTAAEAELLALDDSGEDDADDILNDATGKKLRDGTDPKKEIKVSKDKFDDLNEKAKLLEQFAPILAKLQKDPALAKKLMEGDDPNASIQERLKALEERERTEKKAEITRVITAALTAYPDFRKHWNSVKAMLPGLEAAGVSYAEAVERAYFAVNPAAAKEGKRIADQAGARDRENERGQGSYGGGGGRIRHSRQEDVQLSDADRQFAQATGLDPALYAKHADWIGRFADL